MSDVFTIDDPRAFPDIASAPQSDAALYRRAIAALAADTAQVGDALAADLRDALSQRLDHDGAELMRLFAGAPSVDVARAVWRALDAAWRARLASRCEISATIFAMPIVVVAAAASGATLDAVLDDTAALVALLREHRALAGNETITLSNALVAPDALDIAALPRVLAWQALEATRDVAPAPIVCAARESVHARLLVGSVLARPDVDVLAHEPLRGWAIGFTRALVRQLAKQGTTLLPLPAPPAYPLQAVRGVRAAQREVAAQLFASNALRNLRARSGEPTAIVSAHRAADAPGGGELRVSLSSAFDPHDDEGFRCPLYPLDRAADVARMLVELLRDCRVGDVRVVGGVHADRVEGSSQRLMFKPSTLPPTATVH